MITLPTLQELRDGIIADLEAEFDATINPDGKAKLRAFADNTAGLIKQLYLAIGALQKNVYPDAADEETLIRYGMVRLNRRPFQGVAGQYQVTVIGTVGTVIPALRIWKSDDDSLNPGILYILDSDHTMAGSSDTITLRCLELGTTGELEIGNTLTLTAPVALLDDSATVTAESVQPLAAETIEDYRTDVINSFRLESLGGAATDYRLWAADVQGVERVYPYAKSGSPCEINLYVEATIADSADGKGTPTQSILDQVEDVVNFDPDTSLEQNERGRRPLQVVVHYIAITPKTVVVTIADYQNLDADIEADNLTALQEVLAEIRPYVAAADNPDDENDTLNSNKLVAALISAKPGANFGAVTFTVDGVSYSTYEFVNGNIPYLTPAIIYT